VRIATWNINSIRLRIQQVLRFVKEQDIDVLCLQETKTPNDFFPSKDFEKIGFVYQYFRGEKSYNGVAILSKLNFHDQKYIDWCNKNDTRHISVNFNERTELHNFYVPAGGDEPNVLTNSKFEHKLSFLNELFHQVSQHLLVA